MSHVTRYTQNPAIKKQDVAQHSYFVVLYCSFLADSFHHNNDRLLLLELAIEHDLGESVSVDIPQNVKRRLDSHIVDELESKALAELGYVDKHSDLLEKRILVCESILKIADLLDVLIYSHQEFQMGNKFFEPIIKEVIPIINNHLSKVYDLKSYEKYIDLKVLEIKVDQIIADFKSLNYNFNTGSIDIVTDYRSMTHIHKNL